MFGLDAKHMTRGELSTPGVYALIVNNTFMYIGATRRLWGRLFDAGHPILQKLIKCGVPKEEIEIRVVPTCTKREALMLEAGFIKDHRPAYNVLQMRANLP